MIPFLVAAERQTATSSISMTKNLDRGVASGVQLTRAPSPASCDVECHLFPAMFAFEGNLFEILERDTELMLFGHLPKTF